MNFADADAVEPDTGSGAGTQEGPAGKFAPQATTIFAGGDGFVEEPGRKEEQSEQIQGVEKVTHGIPFPARFGDCFLFRVRFSERETASIGPSRIGRVLETHRAD